MARWLELCKHEDQSWALQNPHKCWKRVLAACTSSPQKANTEDPRASWPPRPTTSASFNEQGERWSERTSNGSLSLYMWAHTLTNTHTHIHAHQTHIHVREKLLEVKYSHLLALEPFLHEGNGEEFCEWLPCPLRILTGHTAMFDWQEKGQELSQLLFFYWKSTQANAQGHWILMTGTTYLYSHSVRKSQAMNLVLFL